MRRPHCFAPFVLFTLLLSSFNENGGVLAKTKDTDNTSSAIYEPILEWIHEKGGSFHASQQIRLEDPDDPTSGYGIYAIEDIPEDTVLASIPWDCIITSGTDTFHTPVMCDSVRLLVDEMRLGAKSAYAPYIHYLQQQPRGQLPSAWSDEGKDLLQLIGGTTMIPPRDVVAWLDVDWEEDCNGSDDPEEQNAVLQFLQRADDDLLIPLYDMYNHKNGPDYNTKTKIVKEKRYEMLTSRDVQKGEQLYNSYNQCVQCGNRKDDYGTPELLRDYGFVEHLPQRFVFHNQEFGFDISLDNDGNYEIFWQEGERPDSKQKAWLRNQYHRLKTVVEPEIQHAMANKKTTIPKNELETIQEYFNVLTTAFQKALEDVGGINPSESDDPEEECDDSQDGVCAFDNEEYYALKNLGRKEPSYHTCNNHETLKFKDYDWIEEIQSNYQALTYMYREEDDEDMCLDLDDIVQICTSYRPQYHEFGTHLPARYMDSVKRAVFVGGGDSMVLHELLKYPEIEKVVGLELDQWVVRSSFKHFHTQPHFDDPRVEWWFGDATKSLLMLPKEYFGSFDLVVVDLSETVMAFTVTKHLDILEALALLLKPEGIFVKNEWYLNKLSSIFDYTIQVYVRDNPIICEQAYAIGSNRVDFLHPNVDAILKDRGHVKTLLLEPVKDAQDRFSYLHSYRKNDARSKGKCGEPKESSEDEPNAGILMILEAENTTSSLAWESLESALNAALKNHGFEPLSSVSNPSNSKGSIGIIVTKDGTIAARTWPEENYCAFDIQLWGQFNKMDSLKEALGKVVGSPIASLSSYRIVVGGMLGTTTRPDDQKAIGPVITQNRNCDEPPAKAKNGSKIDQNAVNIMLEESIKLFQAKDPVVLVLCGDEKQECKSLDFLKKNKSLREVIPLYTCKCIESAPYLDHGLSRMFQCEVETLKMLREQVETKQKLSGLVLDGSARSEMTKVVDRIWLNPRYQKQLLTPHVVFIAPMLDKKEKWRRNFLGHARRNIESSETAGRAEVILKTTDGKSMELGLLSVDDGHFYANLMDVVEAIEKRTGLAAEIPRIDGASTRFQKNYNQKWFKPDDYDSEPGKQQFAEQKPLGEQMVLQLQVNETKKVADNVENALIQAVKSANFTLSEFHVFEEFGTGVVYVVVATEGSVVVVWDGEVRVDINLFAYEADAIKEFVKSFKKALKKAKLKPTVLLKDEFPRGVGRVINFKKEIEPKKEEPIAEHPPTPAKIGRVVKVE